MPKDTKQLVANYSDIPQNLIAAIVKSNDTRKMHIANMVLKQNPKTVGIYKLAMKKNSDNFRTSAMIGIMEILKNNKVNVIIFEPNYKKDKFQEYEIVNDLQMFAEKSDIILANRLDSDLDKYRDKVYTRDLYGRD